MRRTRIRNPAIVLAVAILAGALGAAPVFARGDKAPEPTGFIDMTTKVGKETQPCVVYVPREYTPRKKWPLVVFLHGAGERGDDGLKQTQVGLGSAIRKHPERFPCLVLMPQCPTRQFWSSSPRNDGTLRPNAEGHITDAIAQILDHYNVDENRVSLTGLSMGGFGTFAYGAKHTDVFSAFMPVCGGGNPDDAKVLAAVPLWLFHGADDSVVPVARSRTMVEALRAVDADVHFTEYPDTDHNSWDKAYGEKDAIRWLLHQKRGD